MISPPCSAASCFPILLRNPRRASSGSKKGLFLGLAAATIALAAGGFWYSRQPGNAISGLLGSQAPKSVATSQPTNFASPSSSSPVSAPPETTAPAISAKTVAPSPTPASSQPSSAASTTSSVPAPSSTRNLKENSIAAVPTPPAVAPPKKGRSRRRAPGYSRREPFFQRRTRFF